MDTQYVYESEAWPLRTHTPRSAIEDSIKDDDAPEFELRFHTQGSTRVVYLQQGHPPLVCTTRASRPILMETLKFPQHLLLGDIDVLISSMSPILTRMDIPIEYQRPIVIKIHDTATSMVQNCSESSNTRSPVLSMVVLIIAAIYYNYIERSSTALESPSESAAGRCCATGSSVDALERVLIKKNEFMDYDCVICMEKLVAGVKVIKMPCSHIYHEGCIKEWLEKRSNLCPLCRFALPRDHSSQKGSG